MFNQDLKFKFISTLNNKNSEKQYTFLFQSTEHKEKEYNKDLFLFTKQNALDLLSSYDLMTHALSAKKSTISRYVDWCVSHYGGINYFATITADNLRDISAIAPNYLTLSDIDTLAKMLRNSCDKLILYLFFYGIDTRELSKIRTHHIDMSSNTLHTKERDIVMPRYILELIIDSCETYRYYSENENVRATCYPLSLNDNSPLKPRELSTNKALDSINYRVKDKMMRIRELTGNNQISRYYLRDSGIVYHIKKVMENNNLDAEKVFKGDWLNSLKVQYKIHYPNANLKFKYLEMII